MTATKPTSATPGQPATKPDPDRLGLSATQLVASGLAAMSATVAASFFGVAGTVIGAALGSVVTVAGNAVYGYSLRRTRNRVRRTLDVAVAQRFGADTVRLGKPAEAADPAPGSEPGPARTSAIRLFARPERLALAAVGLFAAVLAVTTGFEFASGKPLSATVTGQHGSGVSIGGGTERPASHPPSGSTPASPASSHPSGAGTGSPSSTVTVTVTPTPSPSETGSPTGSGSADPTPSGSASASQTATQTGAPATRG